MMAHSLADQLGWCITTKDYLNNLNQELMYVKGNYRNSVDTLRGAGYLQELMPSLEKICQEFEEEVEGLVRYIEDEHTAYVQGRSATISEQINQAMGL